MVTALEILLYLNGFDPNGVEYPGTYGNGLVTASKKKFGDDGLKVTASEFIIKIGGICMYGSNRKFSAN